MAQSAVAAQAGKAAPQTKIGTDDDPTRGLPYHDKITQDLKAALNKKRLLEKSIANIEETIYKKEGEYLEDTPHGNILTGFDNYIKGISSSSAAIGRRKQGVNDNDRLFSRSSMKLSGDFVDSPGALSTGTTPSAAASRAPSGAPTPVTGSFVKGDSSNHATPTSSKGGAAKNKKRGKAGEIEDSETEDGHGKKARSRK